MSQNVSMSVEKNTLTIRIDLAKTFGPSKSGKTITIARTQGNIPVPGAEHVKIGLNVYM